MMDEVGTFSGKGSKLRSADMGSCWEITTRYEAVGLVKGIDLWHFVELQMQEARISTAGTFLYFSYFFGTNEFLQGGQNSC